MSNFEVSQDLSPVAEALSDSMEQAAEQGVTIQQNTNRIRICVSDAIRRFFRTSASATYSTAEVVSGKKSIHALAEVIRNGAALLASLQELASLDVQFSRDVAEITVCLGDILQTATQDLGSLAQMSEKVLASTVQTLDNAAEAVEKTEELLSLTEDLASLSFGVNNLGVDVEDFRRLAGVDKSQTGRGGLPCGIPFSGDPAADRAASSQIEHESGAELNG